MHLPQIRRHCSFASLPLDRRYVRNIGNQDKRQNICHWKKVLYSSIIVYEGALAVEQYRWHADVCTEFPWFSRSKRNYLVIWLVSGPRESKELNVHLWNAQTDRNSFLTFWREAELFWKRDSWTFFYDHAFTCYKCSKWKVPFFAFGFDRE